LINLR